MKIERISRYAKYLAAGMCVRCGCRPPREGMKTCTRCYATKIKWEMSESGRKSIRQCRIRYQKSSNGKAAHSYRQRQYEKSLKGKATYQRYKEKYNAAQPKNWCCCGVKKWVARKMCSQCRYTKYRVLRTLIWMQNNNFQVIDLFESSYEHVIPWPWISDFPSWTSRNTDDDLRSAMIAQGAEMGRWRNIL
jgi:hypothetical protein